MKPGGTGPWRRLYLIGSHFMEIHNDVIKLVFICV